MKSGAALDSLEVALTDALGGPALQLSRSSGRPLGAVALACSGRTPNVSPNTRAAPAFAAQAVPSSATIGPWWTAIASSRPGELGDQKGRNGRRVQRVRERFGSRFRVASALAGFRADLDRPGGADGSRVSAARQD